MLKSIYIEFTYIENVFKSRNNYTDYFIIVKQPQIGISCMLSDEEVANFVDLSLDEYNNMLINKFNGYHVSGSSSVFFNTEEDVNNACVNLNLIYKMLNK